MRRRFLLTEYFGINLFFFYSLLRKMIDNNIIYTNNSYLQTKKFIIVTKSNVGLILLNDFYLIS